LAKLLVDEILHFKVRLAKYAIVPLCREFYNSPWIQQDSLVYAALSLVHIGVVVDFLSPAVTKFVDFDFDTSVAELYLTMQTPEMSVYVVLYLGLSISCPPSVCLSLFAIVNVNGPYLLDNLMIKLRLPVVLYVSFAVGS